MASAPWWGAWPTTECCACALSHADTQAVVAWLCKDLGLLCEQREAPCQHAEVARAVLAGECMRRRVLPAAMVGEAQRAALGVWRSDRSQCSHTWPPGCVLTLNCVKTGWQPLGLLGGPAAVLRTGRHMVTF